MALADGTVGAPQPSAALELSLLKMASLGDSLVAWWLGFSVFTAETQVQAWSRDHATMSRGKAKNTKEKIDGRVGSHNAVPGKSPLASSGSVDFQNWAGTLGSGGAVIPLAVLEPKSLFQHSR